MGVFRPLTTVGATGETDLVVDLLVDQPGIEQTYSEALGVTYEAAREDADEALHQIVERFGQLTDRFEVIVVVGSDYTDVTTGTELSFNAKIAANLGSPVVLVVHGRERTPEQIRAAADSALAELRANHAQTVAVIANRVERGRGRDPHGPGRPARHGDARRSGESAAVAPTFRDLARRPTPSWCSEPRMDGPGVARPDRRGDEAAERPGPAAPGRHGDRARRPLRPDAGPDPGPPVRHVPDLAAILLTGGYAIPETSAADRGRAAGPADRGDRLGTFETAERCCGCAGR